MRKCIVFILQLCVLQAVKAQETTTYDPLQPWEDSSQKNEFSIGVFMAFPSQKMRPLVNNHIGDFGFGASLQMLGDAGKLLGKDRSGLKLGGNLSYTFLGRFITKINSGDELKTSYGLVNLNAVARLTKRGPALFIPYVDFFGGACTYFARTKWRFAPDEVQDLRNTIRFGLNRGIAGGMNFITRAKANSGWGLRFAYQWAGNVRYVVRNSVQYVGGNSITYSTDRATIAYATGSVLILF